ncbi:MAG: hypothetical protein ABI612_23095 [Betaproteobacteria bacterium]
MTTIATRTAIHASLETGARYAAVTMESAALQGLLGKQSQLLALSEVARELRAAGDEAGYQELRALAYTIEKETK